MTTDKDKERVQWWRQVRHAARSAYGKTMKADPQVVAAFGDAFTFYKMVSLPWRTSRGLATGGWFYPNEIIDASDDELLNVREIGPSGLDRIRETLTEKLAVNKSVSDLLDSVTREKLRPEFDLPRRSELRDA
jgi:hypothetical protein